MRILTLLLCSLLLSACGEGFSPQFKPNLGDKRTIQQDDSMTMTMQVMGQSMPMSVNTGSAWLCEVTEVAENGDATLKLTADRMDTGQGMLENMPGMNIDLSFLNQAQDAVKGQSFTARVTPAGEIIAIEGTDEIVKHVLSKVTMPRNLPGMNPQDLLRQAYGEPTFRRVVETWMAPYQPATAEPSKTWQKSGTDDFEMMQFAYTQTYTLQGIENGIAKISFEKIFSSSGAAGDMMGMPINMEPSGNATGTLEMDTATGWIKSMHTQVNMNIKTSMQGMPGGGMEMEMQLSGNNSLQIQ